MLQLSWLTDLLYRDVVVKSNPPNTNELLADVPVELHEPLKKTFVSKRTWPNQTWEIGRFSMKTKRYVGKR